MSTYLLDANVAIALTVFEHEHHQRAMTWLRHVEAVALCPIVQGALVRYLVRVGSADSAPRALTQVRELRKVEFWPDSLSYEDVPLSDLRGHRQVTDVYLAALAASHGGKLATLDAALAQLRPDDVVLIPE